MLPTLFLQPQAPAPPGPFPRLWSGVWPAGARRPGRQQRTTVLPGGDLLPEFLAPTAPPLPLTPRPTPPSGFPALQFTTP